MKVLKTLLDNGANLNGEDKLGNTALLLASKNGHVKVVKELLKRRANVSHRDNEGKDIWNYAIEEKGKDLLKILVQEGAAKAIHMTSRQPLFFAAKSGKCDAIKYLLKFKRDFPVRDTETKNTFLHYAAKHDQHVVIEMFHSAKLINLQNKRGNTPLHIACKEGFEHTIKTLLKYQANTDILNDKGETALHVAAKSKHITAQTVQKLVSYTIKNHSWESLNGINKEGKNCLHVAGRYAKPDVLWAFKDICLEAKDNGDNTPLHEAVRSRQPETLSKYNLTT